MSCRTKVHQCRFTDYIPSAIHVIAASPCGNFVAVGREDGDIELQASQERFRIIKRIAGRAKMSLRSLCWCKGTENNDRLIGCALNGTVFELDFINLTYKNVRDSYGGAAWCMSIAEKSKLAAVGCEDGSLKLFSFDDNSLEYSRSISSTGSRILSVVWTSDEENLFTGSADSMIRAYTASGKMLYHMLTETVEQKPTLVWTLAILSDYTLLSGDSIGNIQWWDTQTGTLLQTLKTHEADVLTLSVTKNEQMIFASGVDSKITQLIKVNDERSGISRWVLSCSERKHTHDVKAVLCFTQNSHEMLISGGIDTLIFTCKVRNFSDKKSFTRIWPMPFHQVVFVALKTKILAVAHNNRMDIWQFQDSTLPNSSVSNQNPGAQKYLEIAPIGDHHISCANISPLGNVVAFSSEMGTRIFSLDVNDGKCHIQKLPLPEKTSKPAQKFVFSPQGLQLIQGDVGGQIRVTDLPQVLRAFEIEGEVGPCRVLTVPADGKYEGISGPNPCTHLCVSRDGKWVVTGDSAGGLEVYSLEDMAHYWTIPKSFKESKSFGNSCISFFGDTAELIIVDGNGGIRVVDVNRKCSSKWCGLPDSHKSLFLGLACNPGQSDSALLYSHRTIIRFQVESSQDSNPRKRRINIVEEDFETKDFFFNEQFDRYKPLLLVEYIGKNELVVVESPWEKLKKSLPDVLFRNRYGT